MGDLEELQALSRKHLEIKEKMDNLKAEDEGIKSQIKIMCSALDIKEFETDGFLVRYQNRQQKYLNREKLSDYIDSNDLKKCYDTKNVEIIMWKKVDENV